MKKIRVPGSSANLGRSCSKSPSMLPNLQKKLTLYPGPGFDVFGLSLKPVDDDDDDASSRKFSICLELRVEQLPLGGTSAPPGNCEIVCEGEGADSLSRAFDRNLVTKVALYVLRSHGIGGYGLSPVFFFFVFFVSSHHQKILLCKTPSLTPKTFL